MGGPSGKTRRQRSAIGHGAPSAGGFADLLHVGSSLPPPGFVHFFDQLRRRGSQAPAELAERSDDALGLTHHVLSADGAALGARLVLPDGARGPADVRGLVLQLHGYASPGPLDDAGPFRRGGLATLKVRVRGFPGSPDPGGEEGEFITRRIDDRRSWSLTGAVLDVLCAYRALRRWGGGLLPTSIAGESFGGGLAIVAASQLSGSEAVHRMAIGVPSLADWPWRVSSKAGGGAGREVLDRLASANGDRRRILANLALFDAVVHARRVSCPIVMKMARRDPVVPPRTVAAVYNALGTGAGAKWRFLTDTAHDPDPAPEDLRRHVLFGRMSAEFLAADDAAACMRGWEDRLLG